MELWSFIIGIVSLVVGVISIVLAIDSMKSSKEESKRSAENYQKTKELLETIEHRSDIIDRTIQGHQMQLVLIINKALDKIGQSPIDFEPMTQEEIVEAASKVFDKKKMPIYSEIQKLKKEVDDMPKIHVGNEPPKNMKNGDVWFTIK